MNPFRRLFGKTPNPPANTPPPTGASTPMTVLAEARTAVQAYRRTAYLPVIEETEPTFSTDSKFGGYPYLTAAAPWPRCPNCGRHKQLFVQLNRATLPGRTSGDQGIVQLFYCTNQEKECEQMLDGWEFGSACQTSRIVEPAGPFLREEPDLEEVYPQRRIVDWTAHDDYPRRDELLERGLRLTDEVVHALFQADEPEFQTLQGDKLYGWPYWVQNVEYPHDTKGERTELLFQVDSEINVPYMFGDIGTGHVCSSKTNPAEMSFGWACY